MQVHLRSLVSSTTMYLTMWQCVDQSNRCIFLQKSPSTKKLQQPTIYFCKRPLFFTDAGRPGLASLRCPACLAPTRTRSGPTPRSGMPVQGWPGLVFDPSSGGRGGDLFIWGRLVAPPPRSGKRWPERSSPSGFRCHWIPPSCCNWVGDVGAAASTQT
jgi:hypothetical protein